MFPPLPGLPVFPGETANPSLRQLDTCALPLLTPCEHQLKSWLPLVRGHQGKSRCRWTTMCVHRNNAPCAAIASVTRSRTRCAASRALPADHMCTVNAVHAIQVRYSWAKPLCRSWRTFCSGATPSSRAASCSRAQCSTVINTVPPIPLRRPRACLLLPLLILRNEYASYSLCT